MSTPSKAAPETGHKHPPSTREQRGLALFREGAVSERGDLFVVRGENRNYTVSVVDGEPRCDCPDFGKRREVCKHGYSVVVYAAKKNAGCRRQRTARPAGTPQRRHAGRTERPREQQDERRRGTAPARSGTVSPAFVRANVARMRG